jgi:hypothetical protein
MVKESEKVMNEKANAGRNKIVKKGGSAIGKSINE